MQRLVIISVLMISCVRITEETNIPSHCKFQLTMYKISTDEKRCPYGCEDGWYGPLCNKRCSRQCKYTLCQQDGGRCINGCTDGWTKHRSCRGSISSRVQRSVSNCLWTDSQNSSQCVCCSNSYRGNNCNLSCPMCRTYNGSGKCKYMCEGGYYGNVCNNTCPRICQTGSKGVPICELKSGTLNCPYGCVNGLHGIQCNNTCPEYCYTCRQNDGKCVNCSETFHGERCTTPCNSTCVDRKCYMNGTCKDMCPRKCTLEDASLSCTKTGKELQCEKPCTINCRVCNHTTGQCTSCHNGWYGSNCSTTCGRNCLNLTCKTDAVGPKITFVCTTGCVDSYRGSMCQDVTARGDSLVGIVVGSGIAVIVLVAIVFMVYNRRNILERCRHGRYQVEGEKTKKVNEEPTSRPHRCQNNVEQDEGETGIQLLPS